MSAAEEILWHDLTVPNAEEVRDFYSAVVGWKPSPVPMEGYEDFMMAPASGGDPFAGVCHKRGANEAQPPVWMVYFKVDDLAAAANRVQEHGGKVVLGPKSVGNYGSYAVIEDPSGAVCSLFEPAS